MSNNYCSDNSTIIVISGCTDEEIDALLLNDFFSPPKKAAPISSSSSFPLITITIPEKANLNIKTKGSEDYKIQGLLSGNLEIHNEGISKVKVEKVMNNLTYIEISSRASIKVGHLNTCKFECALSEGRVTVENGSADSLSVQTSSTGDFKFNGTAQDVDASASGVSNIYVKKATGKINKDNKGVGKVFIGQ